MKVPAARVFLKYNTEQLEPALTLNVREGCGLGLVVFPCISISHVFERFNVILLLAAQSLMLLISLIVASVLSLLTGMLMVMSSANFTKRFLLGSANCMSLTIKAEQDGAKDTSLRHASIDIYELCGYSIKHDPLFSLTQEVKDPVDHIFGP